MAVCAAGARVIYIQGMCAAVRRMVDISVARGMRVLSTFYLRLGNRGVWQKARFFRG